MSERQIQRNRRLLRLKSVRKLLLSTSPEKIQMALAEIITILEEELSS